MTIVVGIACEDNGHFSAVTRLVDDSLAAAHDWLEGILDSQREWRGLEGTKQWYKYDASDARDVRPITIDGFTIKPNGHIGGEPLKSEAGMWRRILMMFDQSTPRPDAVILARDVDGHRDRCEGLKQVLKGLPWRFPIIVAAAEPEVEAWHVAGYVSTSAEEEALLSTLASELSFNPTLEAHRLTSHPNDARTDAKLVLERLCTSEDRKHGCLTDRAVLRMRGTAIGLSNFLDEVAKRIVPLFGEVR